MANIIYDSFRGGMNGDFDWDDAGENIKLMMVDSGYVPDKAHSFVSDVTNEVTGTGYTAGGNAVANRTIAIDGATHVAKYSADNIVFTASTITARGAVIYKDSGTPTTSPLIGYIDFGAEKSSSNGDYTIQWSSDGIFTIS